MTASVTLSEPSALAQSIEDDLATARDLNRLVDWIGQARQQIDDLRLSARDNSQLDELLKKRHVRAHGPDWSNDLQGMGLYRVHDQIEGCLERIAVAMGLRPLQ